MHSSEEARSGNNRKQKSHPVTGGFSLEMVGRIGFEPMTNGLKVQCSTN